MTSRPAVLSGLGVFRRSDGHAHGEGGKTVELATRCASDPEDTAKERGAGHDRAADRAGAVWFRPDPRAPSVARRFITTACEASGLHPDICATAALLVSELVTNAVVHAGTDVQMQVLPAERRLRVQVSDADPADPPQMLPVDPRTARGRGLRLVDVLATRWGVDTAPARKTVWFELDLMPSSDATASVARSVAAPV